MKCHSDEFEVQEILAYKVRDKRRKYLFTQLRHKGNFLKSASNENVVPVRQSSDMEKPTVSSFLPCKYCKGFYKKKYLYRHIKTCPQNKDSKNGRINAISEGQSLFATYKKDDILRKEVFPTMRGDDISFVAKTDNSGNVVKQKRILQPWTEQQKNFTIAYFKNHIKKTLHPKKMNV